MPGEILRLGGQQSGSWPKRAVRIESALHSLALGGRGIHKLYVCGPHPLNSTDLFKQSNVSRFGSRQPDSGCVHPSPAAA